MSIFIELRASSDFGKYQLEHLGGQVVDISMSSSVNDERHLERCASDMRRQDEVVSKERIVDLYRSAGSNMLVGRTK